MRSTLKRFAAIGTAALLVACGGGDDPKDPTDPGVPNGSTGTFSGSATGDLTVSLGGSAIFGTADEGLAADGLELGLGAFTAANDGTVTPGSVVFYRTTQALPAVGEYPIFFDATGETEPGDDDFMANLILRPAGGSMYMCNATDGRLRVTSRTTSQIGGSFTLSALCARPLSSEEAEVSVTGTFTAAKGIQTIPTGR